MISNEELIYNKLVELYPNSLKAISEISKNTTDDNFFVESQYKAFDFDDVKNCHLGCDDALHKSPDSLFLFNNALYFIEFKEGDAKPVDIRSKIHEAIATLYTICVKYLSDINREDFFNLNIRYAVMMRKGNPKTFLGALRNTSNRFRLKNLEGYIVKKTKVTNNPVDIVKTLRQLTQDSVLPLKIHNREHPVEEYT
ncbi:hypothetical protein [Pseudoalteromonas aliena]|uniref:Uncharacterized protein n=1 Tax=Pseudoalteromonas aliena SW19 TaxID=1314866 RepID=A0ABR9DU65_9GAMM|nr:hypothetical protein [Pseudoalteromonas aliena]MBE0357905.1 hypothetical protein [Pseudoalteromonas aliena SW19]